MPAEGADGNIFDYVIVGGGVTGALLAERLTENPGTTVCLIEPEQPERNQPGVRPSGPFGRLQKKSVCRGYETAPQAGLNGRRVFWQLGEAAGAGQSRFYLRGAPADYDGWARDGAAGWDWASLLPYFKKSKANGRGAGDGRHAVGSHRRFGRVSSAFFEAGRELGVPFNPDFNSASMEGLGFYSLMPDGAGRNSVRAAKERANLSLLSNVSVMKILFEGKRANALELSRRGALSVVKARWDIILCGGAVSSPHLLMLSGIGASNKLKPFGIDPIAERPGVGRNLQDHIGVALQGMPRGFSGRDGASSAFPRKMGGGLVSLLAWRGMRLPGIAQTGGFIRNMPEAALPDVQFHLTSARVRRPDGRALGWRYGYHLHISALQPDSRGEIRLASSAPKTAPFIDPGYLSDERDRTVLLEGLRFARRLLDARAFARYRGPETVPGPNAQSDAELLAFIREHAVSSNHLAGTCRMGRPGDPDAVVDPELNVIGVGGLRVVDASIMPRLIRGNLEAPLIAIAERAAELIRKRQER